MKNSGQFTRERSLGNQWAEGNPPNKTSFVKGQRAGAKNNTWKGGLQKMRDCYYVYLGVGKRQVRARYVWEQHYGKIPAGMVVYHINGDKYDDDILNLKLITRAELAVINKKNGN